MNRFRLHSPHVSGAVDRGSKRRVVVHHVNKARHFPLLAVNQNRQKSRHQLTQSLGSSIASRRAGFKTITPGRTFG